MQVALTSIVVLAACNQVYDLDATRLRDGASPDAPYACTDKAPVLRGSPVPVDIGAEYTRFYSISLDRRIAVGNRIGGLFEGPGDAPLTKGALLMPPPPTTIGAARLSPEGDELFVRYTQATSTIRRYRRVADLWSEQATILTVTAAQADISIPTRKDIGPRRMLVSSSTEMREYEETSPDTWTQVGAPYMAIDLGAPSVLSPNLSPDGLRLVFRGQDIADGTLFYASRPSLAQRFGMPVRANPFFGNPRLDDPFILDDCSRLYFLVVADPAGVFYVEPN